MPQAPDDDRPIRLSPEPRARLRVVGYGESVDVLPGDPDLFIGRAVTGPRAVAWAVALVVATVALAWAVPVKFWDDTGSHGWVWNAIWVVFPWLFIVPLWILFVSSMRRRPERDEFRARYPIERDRARSIAGTVTDTRVTRTDEGGVREYVATVTADDGTVVVTGLAPRQSPAEHELPRKSDRVHLWLFDDDRTLIQAATHRVGTGPAQPFPGSESDGPSSIIDLNHLIGKLSAESYQGSSRRHFDQGGSSAMGISILSSGSPVRPKSSCGAQVARGFDLADNIHLDRSCTS